MKFLIVIASTIIGAAAGMATYWFTTTVLGWSS